MIQNCTLRQVSKYVISGGCGMIMSLTIPYTLTGSIIIVAAGALIVPATCILCDSLPSCIEEDKPKMPYIENDDDDPSFMEEDGF